MPGHRQTHIYRIALIALLEPLRRSVIIGRENDGFQTEYLYRIITKHFEFWRYENSVDNTADENSSVFSLTRIRWWPSARQ